VRTSACLFFVIALASAASLPAAARYHAKPHVHSHKALPYRVIRVAPADEYFGRMKMSILGIRNQLHDLALRLRYTPDKSEDVLGSASMVEDAMYDWDHKYHDDPWLPKSFYDLTSLYAGVHTPHGHERATHALRWLLTRYPRTHYAALARMQLKRQIGYR
jgi:hypothetical protein